jgi:hypothetical protein
MKRKNATGSFATKLIDNIVVLKFGRMITFSLLFGAIIWLGNNIEIII